jgi:hypothetical protein
MTAIPTSRARIALLGRTSSYRLNAYDDAAIAGRLVCYVAHGETPRGIDPVSQRAADFIARTPEDCHRQRLIAQAYTLHKLNGLADLMWARVLERWAGLPVLALEEGGAGSDGYSDHEDGPLDVTFWIPPLVFGNLETVEAYARKRAGEGLALSARQFAREVARVQHANIAANRQTQALIQARLGAAAPSTHPKVERLHALAERVPHPATFIRAAARTQIAAARWDYVVIAMLRLRWWYGSA